VDCNRSRPYRRRAARARTRRVVANITYVAAVFGYPFERIVRQLVGYLVKRDNRVTNGSNNCNVSTLRKG